MTPALRLCANENIPDDRVVLVGLDGQDVLWIRKSTAGRPDSAKDST